MKMDKAMEEKGTRTKIQIEQIKLLKAEKLLSQLLTKINENINSLAVEELQLRANEIISDIKPKLEQDTSDVNADFKLDENNLSQTQEEINKQNLFLDVFGCPMIDQQEYDSS